MSDTDFKITLKYVDEIFMIFFCFSCTADRLTSDSIANLVSYNIVNDKSQ